MKSSNLANAETEGRPEMKPGQLPCTILPVRCPEHVATHNVSCWQILAPVDPPTRTWSCWPAELLSVTRRSYYVTSLLTLRRAFFLKKNLIIGQLVKIFCAFYATRKSNDLLHKDLPLAIVGNPLTVFWRWPILIQR
jgi:hypothetical protein